MTLETAETRYGHGAFAAQRFVEAQRFAQGEQAEILLEPTTTSDVVADVYANHGRWVVDCPFCDSAQVASLDDRRFFCVDCHNADVGGAWVKVRWPRNHEEIATVLSERPEPLNRNWTRREKADDLRAENELHRDEIERLS